jgi:LmbE family N-acetylglucosaminyl deacetylase
MKQAHPQKIMVLAPHPDDALIGCGGSISKHLQNNNTVLVIYLTSGEAGNTQYEPAQLAPLREKEAQAALEVLGKIQAEFWRQPDGFLEFNEANLQVLVQAIRQHKPDILYLPHAGEAHQDHQVANRLGLQAFHRASGHWFPLVNLKPHKISQVLSYEVYPLQNSVNYVEDISEHFDLKLKALQEHKSQLAITAYDDLIQSVNRYRGIFSGYLYAEAFQVIHTKHLFQFPNQR